MIERWHRCGQVSPFWVDIGWVHWAGTPTREKLFNIEYRRCENTPLPSYEKDGFVYHHCTEHQTMKKYTVKELEDLLTRHGVKRCELCDGFEEPVDGGGNGGLGRNTLGQHVHQSCAINGPPKEKK